MGSWEYYLKEDYAVWSKELYRIFGLDPQKPAPNTTEYLKMFHPDEVNGFAEKSKAFAYFGKLGETLSIDYRIIKPDGEMRDIHSVRMIRNSENGLNTRIVGIEQDVTERRKIEKQLEQYSKDLEKLVAERTSQLQEKERLAAIGETAAMVGHDIRNPLQTIINELYLARQISTGTDKTEVLESLNLIQEQVDYISKIVSDLQDYARPLKPEYNETNLNDLLVSTFNAIQIPKDIVLQIKVIDTIIFRADRVFLKRALTNLINNAIQAMPQGGQLKLSAYRKDSWVVLTVSDTGLGIPEEVKADLYKPLVTIKSKGQGFGLAVVKRLVEALGGQISFKTELGKGTEFTIEVPFRKE
jgi:signal transduction histidine kinase